MIAIMDLIMTVLTFGLGFVSGRLIGRTKNRAPKQSKAKCGCGCERAFHDPKTRECHGLVKGDPVKFDAFHDPTAWSKVRCPCRQYDGPEKPMSAEDIIAGFIPPQ